MRTLMKAQLDVNASNTAIQNGSLPKLIESMIDRLKPEASYFLSADGKRTCLFVFDMKDPSEIPSIAEPFFQTANAAVTFTPVMNANDLRAGLEKLPKMK